jgi:hypothetical protein
MCAKGEKEMGNPDHTPLPTSQIRYVLAKFVVFYHHPPNPDLLESKAKKAKSKQKKDRSPHRYRSYLNEIRPTWKKNPDIVVPMMEDMIEKKADYLFDKSRIHTRIHPAISGGPPVKNSEGQAQKIRDCCCVGFSLPASGEFGYLQLV